MRASRGKWVLAPHLSLLNRKLAEVLAGRCKRLIVSMPPRHGKSEFVSKYFPALYLGSWPDRRVMLGSYEATFAASWGRKARDLIEESGRELFGIALNPDSTAADRWDVRGRSGGMQTAGVGGAFTGKGADLFILDDPIKNAAEANSEVVRRNHAEWWDSTAYTRLEPGGAAIVMATRWHQEDLSGRLISRMESGGEPWDVLNLPALAEENDPLGREPGEALWPARYPVPDLERIRANVGPYWWSALYQGRPQPQGGGFFKYAWFAPGNLVTAVPREAKRVRYWDTAGTEGGGDFTVGTLMARSPQGVYFVEDVIRGQWSPHHRNQRIRDTAERDGADVTVWLEKEAGVGGKDRTDDTIRALAGYVVRAEGVTGSKQDRAEPFSAQAEAGNVRVKVGAWNTAWLTELCEFPHGKHDDQVDSASGAFAKLAPRAGGQGSWGPNPFG